MSISRRNRPIGPALAMAFALALTGAAPAQVRDTVPRLKVGDQWNHGDDPWDSHPGNFKFIPKKVGIIHIELLDSFRVKVTRFHYDTLGTDTDRSWALNQATAIKVINWLNGNGEEPAVEGGCRIGGLRDLIFGQPHHVVVYIKNENITYPVRPIWFGNSLQGTVKEHKGPARENHSFFKTNIITPTGQEKIEGAVSKQFIYFENHFHKHNLLTGHDPILKGEIRVYSMKIALFSQSIKGDVAEDFGVPIIIDPDTGNMGGGEPFVCR